MAEFKTPAWYLLRIKFLKIMDRWTHDAKAVSIRSRRDKNNVAKVEYAVYDFIKDQNAAEAEDFRNISLAELRYAKQ